MWVDSYGSRYKYQDKRLASKRIRLENKKLIKGGYWDFNAFYEEDHWPEEYVKDHYHSGTYAYYDNNFHCDRHTVPDGCAYKKYYDPWNIVDSKSKYTTEGYWYVGHNFNKLVNGYWARELMWMEPSTPKWKAIRK